MEETNKSYLQERIFDTLGLTKEENLITLGVPGRYGMTVERKVRIFDSDSKDNILITLYDLNYNTFDYPDPKNEERSRLGGQTDNELIYQVTRLNPKNIPPGSKNKYLMPPGQPIRPFFPPRLVKKYKEQVHIPMLILTEGYIKAMCASIRGFDVVGLSSITHYADSNTKRLHSDIEKLIIACGVKTVVLLYDGDCLDLSKTDLEEKSELTRRPAGFYNAALRTRELLNKLDVKVYFAHINSEEFANHPKGLDDLLLDPEVKDNPQDVLDEIESCSKREHYFVMKDITNGANKLQSYFHLKSPEQFYEAYVDEIGDREFVFYGSTYKYNPEKRALDRMVPKELKNYIRVGDYYFEIIKVPLIREPTETEERMEPRLKGTIIDDFGRAKLRDIPRYKAFINLPSHDNYQRVIMDCYNRYYPLAYTPEPGIPWPHIQDLIMHIFGPEDDREDQYQMGLDYLQLLYQKPLQILPILCLVSEERETGKSSFLNLLRAIFSNNMVIVGSSEMQSPFNAITSQKLLVGVDESEMGDNAQVTERLKFLSTALQAPMQKKGLDHQEVENFTKFILCSNDETHFMRVQKGENRLWVRRISPIDIRKKVANIYKLFRDEIPGFLAYINTRKLSTEGKTSRMWFTAEEIHTKALDKVTQEQTSSVEKTIRTIVQDLFTEFPQESYELSVEAIQFLDPSLQRVHPDYIRNIIRNGLMCPEVVNDLGIGKVCYVKVPYHVTTGNEEKTEYYIKRARAFTFRPENVMGAKEAKAYRAKFFSGGTDQEISFSSDSNQQA